MWGSARICRIHPSAEGAGHILSSGFEDANTHSAVEDCIGLPSLPDLLNELDRDVDIESLEQLTQSLLQDIAADLEAAAQKTNCQESDVGGQNGSGQVVGSPSEDLESSRCDSVKSEKNGLEQEISPFLLLHHDYSAKQDTQAHLHKTNPKITQKNTNKTPSISKTVLNKNSNIRNTNLNTKTKLKPIMPKTAQNECNLETLYINTPDISMDSSDVLYGTLDESTNCITIIVNDENLHLSEAVTEVTTTEEDMEEEEIHSNQTSLLTTDTYNMQTLELPVMNKDVVLSPAPSYSSSDCGYESFDSPRSVDDIEVDAWDKSVSELFPMLL